MSSVLKEYFNNLHKNNKISHAFLLCNTNYDNLKEELSLILSDYFFDGQKLNIEDNSDIYVIKPENGKILKEKVLSLQEMFKSKSQINDKRVYIIDGVQMMNDFASNSILKFLEEPEDNIYAFLITSNINKVLPTIKSRCQVLMIDNKNNFDLSLIDADIINMGISFIKCFEKYKTKSIAYIYDFLPKKSEKENIKDMISIIKYFYRDILSSLLNMDIEYFDDYMTDIIKMGEQNTVNSLINKLIILNKCENMLEYNLNLNLFLDKLIIEMGTENYE